MRIDKVNLIISTDLHSKLSCHDPNCIDVKDQGRSSVLVDVFSLRLRVFAVKKSVARTWKGLPKARSLQPVVSPVLS